MAQVPAKSENKNNARLLFAIEFVLAITLILTCSILGMSNLLWTSDYLYPNATDLLGHMTKVEYIAEQLAQGHISSWFPYWYNGTAATQYYVPLSYYVMVPIYQVTGSIMLTYKIFCAGVMTIGGLGVWVFCYKKIGRFCGLFGIIAFCLQPLLLASLYREGVIAQGVVFAIMPWFLLLILSCAAKPSRGGFVGTTILTALLILSHAMHAFMVCFTTVIALLIYVLMKKITLRNLFIALGSIVLAGILTAFWSLVGATGLENPGIPYLLPESAEYTTANYEWFIPNSGSFFYFSIVVSGLIVLALICHTLSLRSGKKAGDSRRYYGFACILLSLVTAVFSFGMQLPGFRYLPFSSGMVPGRILTFTSVTGAIAGAYAIHILWKAPKMKLIKRLFSFGVLALMCVEMNPLKYTYQTLNREAFQSMRAITEDTRTAFDKGRYQWYASLDSSETILAYENNLNISLGVNIEGTPHHRMIYNNYIALPLKKYDYITKQLAFWNIRYLLLSEEYEDLGMLLQDKMLFYKSEEEREGVTFYVSDMPSSYYLTDHRNALVISSGMQGLSIHFPNLVQGHSADLLDYTMQELQDYRLIYIIEPDIRTRTQKQSFEAMVTELVDAGITVLIEPGTSKAFSLFEVHSEEEIVEDAPVFTTTADSPYALGEALIEKNSGYRTIRGLYGLDEIYATLSLKEGNIQNTVIGAKRVGDGEVIFIGAHLSQYLEGVYTRNNGIYALNDIVSNNSQFVEEVYSKLFSYYGVNENYMPDRFDTVLSHQWDYDGGSFTYQSDTATEVTVSVTYSPRWKVTLDGEELEVGQREHLITLKLPAGKHTVQLYYGVTIYGRIGYLITAIGIILFLLVILLWNKVIRKLNKDSEALRSYLQLEEYDSQSQIGMDEAAAALTVDLSGDETAAIPNTLEDELPVYNVREVMNEQGVRIEVLELEYSDTEDGDAAIIYTEDEITRNTKAVDRNTVIANAGDRNTQNINTEDGNALCANTGDGNTMSANTEDGNVVSANTEDRNTVSVNTEDGNTGYIEAGFRKTDSVEPEVYEHIISQAIKEYEESLTDRRKETPIDGKVSQPPKEQSLSSLFGSDRSYLIKTEQKKKRKDALRSKKLRRRSYHYTDLLP